MSLAPTPTAFAEHWQRWHDAHEAQRSEPYGLLAVTHLHWLTGVPAALEGVPGRWWVTADVVHVTLAAGERLAQDGVELAPADGGELTFAPIAERAGITMTSGTRVIELAKRGGEYVLRPRDPLTSMLASYTGTPTFTPDERFVVTGRYVPFATPRETTVGAAVEGIHHVYQAPGELQFSVDGQPLTLTVFNAGAPGTFLALFTDATSGVSTYAANRALTVTAPVDGGPATLDFNRAVNLPCAYTDLATCPLPPAENRLPVAITAGEQTPRERGVAL